MTEPSKDQKLKSISFKFRGAYVHEKTYGGGSAVAERVYIIIGKKGLEYSSPFEAYCNAHLAESFFKQAQENYFATSTANIK